MITWPIGQRSCDRTDAYRRHHPLETIRNEFEYNQGSSNIFISHKIQRKHQSQGRTTEIYLWITSWQGCTSCEWHAGFNSVVRVINYHNFHLSCRSVYLVCRRWVPKGHDRFDCLHIGLQETFLNLKLSFVEDRAMWRRHWSTFTLRAEVFFYSP